MLSFLGFNEYKSCAAFIFLVFTISILVVVLTNKSLFDLAKQDASIFNDSDRVINDNKVGAVD
jgi:hypothetical protein